MSALERHFSVQEISELWNLSTETIRNLFRDVPGVLKIGKHETRYKRGYVTLRIPESVLQRVHAEL